MNKRKKKILFLKKSSFIHPWFSQAALPLLDWPHRLRDEPAHVQIQYSAPK